jgi:UDP-N-acetylmuramoyl-tripeptide--D-alanyl-D-alanine ligase
MKPELIVNIFFIAFAIFDLVVMLRWDMQMLQQNSYRNERYGSWIKASGETASLKRILDIVVLLCAVSKFGRMSYYVMAIMAAVVLFQAISLLKKKYKKPLVFTKRVKRLYFTELVLMIVAEVVTVVVLGFEEGIKIAGYVAILFVSFSYAFTLAVNWLMKPVEEHINNNFVKDAEHRLAQMPGLTVIGITGSYGKTSTKHYLYRILSEKYSVLMTPGSFNTPMGVVRTVREMMQPYNEIFICEMGAKNIGDVKEICDIVHPKYGIITAVGPQHLESFKTIENVQRTKFELADALPADGMAVVNNDFEFVANREVSNVAVKRYSVNDGKDIDFHAENIKYSNKGTTFTVVGDGQSIELSTKLVGECNISNLIAAVIIALKLDVPHIKIQYAVSKIEQVEHRLNMKHTAAGITIIDDAYNSNPSGSRMALDVLSQMTDGKRIVITPGMIELGDKQEYYNELLGEHIAETCDVAIVVGQYNREAITKGIFNKGMDKDKVHTTETFNEAQQLMLTIARRGDTVLYENDLPDTFK